MNFPKPAIAAAIALQVFATVACAQSPVVLPAIQAAHINGRQNSKNFGKTETLEIKKSKTGKQDRVCYLQFDLSESKEAVEFAVLDCAIAKPAETPIWVGASGSNWKESRITWNRKLAKW